MVIVVYVAVLAYVLQDNRALEQYSLASLTESARDEYARGRFVEAEALLTRALEVVPLQETQRARLLCDVADIQVNLDQLTNAEQNYRQALAIYKRLEDDAGIAMMLRNLGALYSLQGRDGDAHEVLDKSLKLARKTHLDPVYLGRILNSFGVTYYREGKIKEASKFFNEAFQTESVETLQNRADLLNNMGAVYHAMREYAKAEDYLKQALEITESIVGPEHPDTTFSLATLAILHIDMGKYAEAEKQFLRALRILNEHDPVLETRIARVLHGLSVVYRRTDRQAEAEETLARAAILARKNISKNPTMPLILDEYAQALRKTGKTKEAEELRGEIRRAKVEAGLVINAHSPF
jgi:tetratricopeptide (TPR) repeat protein